MAIKLVEGDEVVSVRTTGGENDMLIFTANGQGIRFPEADLRPMGRATQGVRGIRLRPGDQVVAATSSADGAEVLLLTSNGYGKRTPIEQFRGQGRGGIGVKAIKLTKARGALIGAVGVHQGHRGLPDLLDGDRHPHPQSTRSAVSSGTPPGCE